MTHSILRSLLSGAVLALGLAAVPAVAAPTANCPVSHDQLTQALKGSVKPSGGPSNGGRDVNEWAAVVNADNVVCAITFSGKTLADQIPASRGISAEKASTANALSVDNFAMSTADLYAGVQPGGSLYGIAATNPPDVSLLYSGSPQTYGTASDPLLGHVLGGVVTFAGGVALYDGSKKVGGLGVSGDSSCADANIVWRVRHTLGLDHVPDGVSPQHNDEIIYDIGPDGKSPSGYGHVTCGGKEVAIAQKIGAGYAPGRAK